jgi:hypothetical protein
MSDGERLFLYNVTITDVKTGPSGTNQYGDWQLYNLWIDDSDWKSEKFGYPQAGNKPVPEPGMKLAKLEFETVVRAGKDGKSFTNYDVKKIEPLQVSDKPVPGAKPVPAKTATPAPQDSSSQTADSPKPQSKPVPSVSAEKHLTFYVSYVKDLVIALIGSGSKEFKEATLHEICSKIVNEAIIIETTVEQRARLVESFTRTVLINAISDLCTKHDLPYKETKKWLGETLTFQDKIQRIFGNLSLNATKVEVLEEIMDTARTWVPIAKKHFKDLAEKKPKTNSKNPFRQNSDPGPENPAEQEQEPGSDQSMFPDDVPY